MARIRTIKPEFWTDEALTECSLSARLLFIGTWNFADDQGNLDRSSKQLKMRIFPSDVIDVEPLIHELITHGLLIEYSVSGQKYLHIPGFTEHQVINRPSKPACPEFDESLVTHTPLTECSVSTQYGRERKGKEGKGYTSPSGDFAAFWESWPKSARKVGKAKCADLWAKKQLDSVHEKIIAHVTKLKASKQWRDGYEPSPITYLNQRRWEDDDEAGSGEVVPLKDRSVEEQQKALDDFATRMTA